MSKRFRFVVCGALAVLMLQLCARTAVAGGIPGYPDNIRGFDPREVAMLPKYCSYTQDFRANIPGGNDPAMIERWFEVMGEMFHHMHHYCYGLMKTNRGLYLVRDAQSRGYYLRDALNEFKYVLEHAPPGFFLTPEILQRKGDNLLRLGDAARGLEALTEATELKPDYWAPYATMSDYYRDAGDARKAREILQAGLSFAPDATGLKRRLAELDTERKPRSAPSSRDVGSKPSDKGDQK